MADFASYTFRADQADMAYEVHAALLKTERDNPALADNRLWGVLRKDAYGVFMRSFEKL